MSNDISIFAGSSLVAKLDTWDSFTWTRDFYGIGNFKLSGRADIPAALELIKGRLIVPPDGSVVYLVEQVERDLTLSNGVENTIIATGRDIGGMFEERICLPPTGQAYDTQSNVSAEQALKAYIAANAGSGAASTRRIPNLTVATNLNRGATYNVSIKLDEKLKW